ncbi:hypothetical protein ACQPX6_25050 [Actinomycetospora sp. CA-101289]|uniref:hypothetical protein n=1 Tax=Actinomycetospora sp. CA-101289 TaxID=3239893 RepID=UPI003D98462B
MVFSARRLLLAALLVVAAVIWVRINKPVEGRVLLELTSRHGVTTADMLALVALAMAVVIAWPSRRPPAPPRAAPPAAPWGQAPGATYGRDRVESPAPGRTPRGGHP